DVVVSQELAPEAAAMLESHFPNHWLFPSVDFTGRGIATHLDAEFGDIEMPRRTGTSALLRIGGEEVWLAGIHFLNPINFPWWVAARARRRQLETLFEWIEPRSGRMVVAGDFNASPVWPAYKEMAGRFSDVVADHAASLGDRAERTWAWRPGWPRLLRVDHVFARGLTATKVSVEPLAGSDHFAVVVDLVLNEGAVDRP
ncbi:MAG: endonuclease/exonuclease/phosphatase family protein, partial [Acidimicrobiia bacterium]